MKILVTGANGQLGNAFRELLPSALFVDRDELDLSGTLEKIAETITGFKPECVIHCAAHTQVDKAESEPDLVYHLNTAVVETIAKTCVTLNARLITYSTDYVFDGKPVENGYKENRPTHPLSVYGKSKADGEKLIHDMPNTTVIRTSWVYGEGANFVRTMLSLADKGLTNLTVVNDQIGRPTYAPDLAEATLKLLKLDTLPKIVHVTNEGNPISWADFAKAIFDLAQRDVMVTPLTTEEYYKDKSGYAPRPAYSVLNLDLLHSLGVTMRPWHEALQEYLKSQ